MKLIPVESQKLHRKKIWTLSDKLDRFRKITILKSRKSKNERSIPEFFGKKIRIAGVEEPARTVKK